MSTEFPPRKLLDDTNPYAPPEAALDVEPVDLIPLGDLAAAEATRKAYIRHEASVKSIGTLHYLGAALGVFVAVVTIFATLYVPTQGNPYGRLILLGVAVFYLAVSGLQLALGIGLTRLHPWARWTDVALTAVVLALYGIAGIMNIVARGDASPLITVFFGSLILGYILYLLLSAKSSTIFSAEYRTIITQTPHIRYRTSLVLKIFLGLLVAIVVIAVIGAVVGRPR